MKKAIIIVLSFAMTMLLSSCVTVLSEVYDMGKEMLECKTPCKTENCNTYQYFLFDFIEYNGTKYYLINSDDCGYDLTPDFSKEYSVYMLEHDESRHNDIQYIAYGAKDDTDCKFLYFISAFYTSDEALASDYYTSPEFLDQFK